MLKKIFTYILLIIVTVVMTGPFLWLTLTAFKGSGEVYSLSFEWSDLTLKNFPYVWRHGNIAKYFWNSVWISIWQVLANVILCSLAAFPLARYKFFGQKAVFIIIISTMMVPMHLIMIPLFTICIKLKLQNTYAGVILPMAVGAFGIFLMRQAFMGIPKDLEDAARIDGSSELGILFRVMLPLTKPTLATLTIFTFVASWSNFLWPLIILNDPEKYTLPVGISYLMGTFSANWHYLAAASILSILPIIIIFLFTQKYFIAGITAGAVKG